MNCFFSLVSILPTLWPALGQRQAATGKKVDWKDGRTGQDRSGFGLDAVTEVQVHIL